ncbi:MAG: hypothetical protein OFPI_20160 [Osedax symbiont Rs2]|nr:MAG: hypothetical protein OFPI_20160 [Osedax symbiont Rs2]
MPISTVLKSSSNYLEKHRLQVAECQLHQVNRVSALQAVETYALQTLKE